MKASSSRTSVEIELKVGSVTWSLRGVAIHDPIRG